MLFLIKRFKNLFVAAQCAAPPWAGKKSIDDILDGCAARPLNAAK